MLNQDKDRVMTNWDMEIFGPNYELASDFDLWAARVLEPFGRWNLVADAILKDLIKVAPTLTYSQDHEIIGTGIYPEDKGLYPADRVS